MATAVSAPKLDLTPNGVPSALFNVCFVLFCYNMVRWRMTQALKRALERAKDKQERHQPEHAPDPAFDFTKDDPQAQG